MDFLTAMEISGTGLHAQRVRMNVAASNVANAATTQTPEGGPYRRKNVVLASLAMPENQPLGTGDSPRSFAGLIRGVEVKDIISDSGEPRMVYEPGHPDADANGIVAYPDVHPVEEMVDMITASRAYEAGVTTINSVTQMADRALAIGRS